MRYKLRCLDCNAVTWVRGEFEEDVNAVSLDERSEWEWNWEEGDASEADVKCQHENNEIVDSESADDESDFFNPDAGYYDEDEDD